MSDEQPAEASETQAAEKAPKPTIARDEKVLAFVAASGETGVTRKAVLKNLQEAEPELSPSQAYLTLNRLKAAGKVTRKQVEGEHLWTAV